MLSREHAEVDLSVEPEGSGDSGQVRPQDVGGFVLRAPRRWPRLSAGIFALGITLTVAAVILAPRLYTVDTTILVQNHVVIPLLGNPRRSVPSDWDSGRVTSESITRRDSLVALVEDTDLLTHWNEGRSPIVKLKDALLRRIFGPLSEKIMMQVMVGTLEKRLTVQVDEAMIKISLTWHDPEIAYRLASRLEENFLRDRSRAVTAPITDTIAILDAEEARQREALAAALAETQRLQLAPPVQPEAPPKAAAASGEPAAKYQVVEDLAEKRRIMQAATAAAEAARQRRLTDLRGQLTELRITYAPQHPLVLAMEERIRQAEAAPLELTPATPKDGRYLRRFKSASPSSGGASEAPAGPLSLPQQVRLVTPDHDDPPELTAAKARLTAALQKYEELRDRIDAARIELQTAEAAFKYRYAIARPPEVPDKPAKPIALIILAGGLVASLVLAIAAAVVKDLASGRFIEPWQVRQRLPVPLLAELEEP